MPSTNFATVRGRSPGARSNPHIWRILIAGILLFGGGEASWSQEKIGGAETVINIVQGNFSTGKQAPVVRGDSVFLNETFSTGTDSKANLLLNDNSSVTVGPGSTLKLDQFVYSGAKQPGTVSFSITNGTLRFITGDANKRAYTIWTPTAAIGARGASLRLKATPTETQVINEEGTAIVCLRRGNERVSVEELRRPCRGRENDAISTGGKSGSCPCTTLRLPSAQATVTASDIAVAEAPLNAVSEPFVGPAKDFRVLAQVDDQQHPFCPPGSSGQQAQACCPPWPGQQSQANQQNPLWVCPPWWGGVGAVAVGTGVVALIAASSSSGNAATPFFISPVSP
jgi:FecR protein